MRHWILMWYWPENTNIDRGEWCDIDQRIPILTEARAEVNIGILWSISHHIQYLNSQITVLLYNIYTQKEQVNYLFQFQYRLYHRLFVCFFVITVFPLCNNTKSSAIKKTSFFHLQILEIQISCTVYTQLINFFLFSVKSSFIRLHRPCCWQKCNSTGSRHLWSDNYQRLKKRNRNVETR